MMASLNFLESFLKVNNNVNSCVTSLCKKGSTMICVHINNIMIESDSKWSMVSMDSMGSEVQHCIFSENFQN